MKLALNIMFTLLFHFTCHTQSRLLPQTSFQSWNQVCGLRTEEIPTQTNCYNLIDLISEAGLPPLENTRPQNGSGPTNYLEAENQINNVLNWLVDESDYFIEDMNGVKQNIIRINLPRGSITISHSINIRPKHSNIILAGNGSENTRLTYDFAISGHMISIQGGNTSSPLPIDIANESNQGNILASDNSVNFTQGDWAYIQRDDIPFTECNPIGERNSGIGQIVKIESVNNNGSIVFSNPSRRTYLSANGATIRKMNPVKNFGIECLSLFTPTLISAPIRKKSKINFSQSVNCWVKGVASFSTEFRHININESSNIEVSGCTIMYAPSSGSGGFGYGVTLEKSTGECLIYNNIFHSLRHAMLVQHGANGNAFIDNFSDKRVSTEFGQNNLDIRKLGDIAVHGRFPFANLFEGNIVEHIRVDHYHGSSGPGNTFFRNRTTRRGFNSTRTLTNGGPPFINLDCDGFATDQLFVIGNDFSGDITLSFGNDHIEQCNFTTGNDVSASCDDFNNIPRSLISENRPDYWTALHYTYTYIWPTIGPNTQRANRNPALDRWEDRDDFFKTVGCKKRCTPIVDTDVDFNVNPVVTPCTIKLSNNSPIITPGRIDLNPSGGVLPYTFQWTVISGGPIVENLNSAIRAMSGTYMVNITDGHGDLVHTETFNIFCINPKTNSSNGDSKYNEIKIYPNPSSNRSFQLSLNPAYLESGIILIDNMGKIVKEKSVQELKNSSIRFDTYQLKSGVYYLQFQYNNEMVIKKVILL